MVSGLVGDDKDHTQKGGIDKIYRWKHMGKKLTSNTWVMLGLVVLVGFLVYMLVGGNVPQTIGGSGTPVNNNAVSTENNDIACPYAQAYTYSAVNKFSTTAVVGTNYIKAADKKPVSSLSAPEVGSPMEYWISNASFFCDKVSEQAECGTHQIQTQCWTNSSLTLTAYDEYTAIESATHNLTMGANDVKNVRLTWQGEAKEAVMPFGGCACVEYPTTISTVTASGEGLSNAQCRFVKTYTVSSTSNTYKCFDVPSGFDASGAGDLKEIMFQFKASASNPSGTAYIKFFPANYYVTNDGQITLGVEQDKNDVTTVAFASANSKTIIIA